MKKQIFYKTIFLALFYASFSIAGTLRGAWQMQSENNSTEERAVLVATINYLTITVFEKNTYIRAYGGPYTIGDKMLQLHLEFNDKHPETVGSTVTFKYLRNNEAEFSIENQLKTTWKRIDYIGNLDGLWRITGRANEAGEMGEMKRGDRKTLKICSGNRFQWFAINPATKEFFGTGGGTYTLVNGKYTETLEFFSRDNTRVGSSLGFTATISDNKWRHTGKSSAGKPVDEIWEKE